MTDEIVGDAIIAGHDRSEKLRNTPVQKFTARMRDALIRSLPNQVMHEVVCIRPNRLHDATPLQFFEHRKQFEGVERGDTGQGIEREASSERCRPGQQLAAAVLQPGQLSSDDGFDAGAPIGIAIARLRGLMP